MTIVAALELKNCAVAVWAVRPERPGGGAEPAHLVVVAGVGHAGQRVGAVELDEVVEHEWASEPSHGTVMSVAGGTGCQIPGAGARV